MPQCVLGGFVSFQLARSEFQLNAAGRSGAKQRFYYESHCFAVHVCDSSPAGQMRTEADLVWSASMDPLSPGNSSPLLFL